MSLFSEIEKTIERGFRRWTERMFGPAESNELLLMSVDVATTPTFTASTPKVLFKLPGPLGGNLGNISRDGQRFVFAVNVPSGGTR